MVTYIIIGVVSFVGNILVISVIRKSKELRHSQYVYKCSIAVSDIIWGTNISFIFLEYCFLTFSKKFRLIEYSKFELSVSQQDQSNVTVYEYETSSVSVVPMLYLTSNYIHITQIFKFMLLPISVFVSNFSLAFSAADRFCALNFPFKYKKTNTIRLAKIISVIIWIIGFLFYFLNIYILRTYDKYGGSMLQPCLDCHENKFKYLFAIIIFVPFFVMWVFTVFTLYNLYKNYKKSKTLNRTVQKAVAAEKQMSIVLILMVFAFTFSLLPTLYNHIDVYFFKEKVDYHVYFGTPENTLIYVTFLATNSIWNIIIYNVFNKKFRVASTKLFKDFFKLFH